MNISEQDRRQLEEKIDEKEKELRIKEKSLKETEKVKKQKEEELSRKNNESLKLIKDESVIKGIEESIRNLEHYKNYCESHRLRIQEIKGFMNNYKNLLQEFLNNEDSKQLGTESYHVNTLQNLLDNEQYKIYELNN